MAAITDALQHQTTEAAPSTVGRPGTALAGCSLQLGSLLVAVTGSDGSAVPLRMAWALAERTGAELRVTSVVEPLPAAAEIATLAGRPELREERHVAQLEAVRGEMARALPPERDWSVELIDGTAASALVRHASRCRAGILLTGRAGAEFGARAEVHDTFDRMLRLGDTPILAVAGEGDELPRTIVAAIDFSAYSIHAARVAMSIAGPDALLYLVHVRRHARIAGAASARWEHDYAGIAPTLLEEVRDQLANSALRIETIVLSGEPASALAAFAESANADLVVAGTHGYGFLHRLVLGSVTTALMRDWPGSLLCVPGAATTHTDARNEMSRRLRHAPLDPETWAHALTHLSRRHIGELCTVEWTPVGGTPHLIEQGHALVGASYDSRDGAVTLMTGAGRLEGPHTTHTVSDVRRIDELRGEDDSTRGLRVVGQRGVTSLRFMP